jgi:hypothetical protein
MRGFSCDHRRIKRAGFTGTKRTAADWKSEQQKSFMHGVSVESMPQDYKAGRRLKKARRPYFRPQEQLNQAALLREARLRSFSCSNFFRIRMLIGVTSTSSSSSM